METSIVDKSLKSSKKKKKAQKEEGQIKESPVILPPTEENGKRNKKKKKIDVPLTNGVHSNGQAEPIKKKRKRTEEPVVEVNGEKEKKKKKKKEKAQIASQTNGINGSTHEDNGSSEIKVKKKKKKKETPLEKKETPLENGVIDQATQPKKKKSKKVLNGHGTTEQLNGETNGKVEEDDSDVKSKQVFQEGSVPVQVTGFDGKIQPATDFAKMSFHADLLKLVQGFKTPTLIQRYCFPALVLNRDVIGIAETGSGKTLAFSLPILTRLLNAGRTKSVKMLVVAPTRELALQTFDVVGKAVPAVCVYGGVSKSEQRQQLHKIKPIVVVGTPGRIVDFLSDDTLILSEVGYFVLDEADRMLDLGFEPDIQKMAEKLPSNRQTIMFSATWPTSIRQMASRYLKNPITIMIGEARGEAKAAQTVQQIVEVIKDPNARDSRLVTLLNQYHKKRENRILVFVLYKKEAARVEQRLARLGWSVGSIHGDKSQQDRTRALSAFKDGSCPLLIATDVAARGLDIPDVEYVINFTFPLTIEDYIHRIGRTGRAGKSGVAHTLFTDNDKAHAGELANVLRLAGLPVPEGLAAYGCAVKKKVHKEYGAFFKEVDPSVKSKKVKFDD